MTKHTETGSRLDADACAASAARTAAVWGGAWAGYSAAQAGGGSAHWAGYEPAASAAAGLLASVFTALPSHGAAALLAYACARAACAGFAAGRGWGPALNAAGLCGAAGAAAALLGGGTGPLAACAAAALAGPALAKAARQASRGEFPRVGARLAVAAAALALIAPLAGLYTASFRISRWEAFFGRGAVDGGWHGTAWNAADPALAALYWQHASSGWAGWLSARTAEFEPGAFALGLGTLWAAYVGMTWGIRTAGPRRGPGVRVWLYGWAATAAAACAVCAANGWNGLGPRVAEVLAMPAGLCLARAAVLRIEAGGATAPSEPSGPRGPGSAAAAWLAASAAAVLVPWTSPTPIGAERFAAGWAAAAAGAAMGAAAGLAPRLIYGPSTGGNTPGRPADDRTLGRLSRPH